MPSQFQIDYSSIISEADVENKVIIPILKNIGLIKFKKDYRLRVPVQMRVGREHVTKEADIVIYKDSKPYLVIEAKAPRERLDDEAVGQLDSYAMWLEATYGMVCNGKEIILRGYLSGNRKVYLIRKSIDKLDLDLLDISLLKEDILDESNISNKIITDQSATFSSLLKQIHQNIRDIDHLDPTNAFDGWSKLLFMKIYEEKWTEAHEGKVRFNYKKFQEEKESERADSYIKDLFKKTCEAYPKIFGESTNEEIGLSIDAIENILQLLDGYNIKDIPMDVKGKAYEIFLSSTFRGKGLGQFFTPRQVVNFMVEMVDFNHETVLLDPACGTGGFLIKGFQKIKDKVAEIPDSVLSNWRVTRQTLLDNIKERQIFGIDAEPRATKTAKMNMIMWGDGENVVRGNGLSDCDINRNPYPFDSGSISLILANPPFGNEEKDSSVQAKYSLYNNHKLKKTEYLFIERAINLLAPGGELAIVIPDGVLVSSITKPVRQLITDNAQIKAVISLPKHTFAPSGVVTICSSILYIKKYSAEYFRRLELCRNDEEKQALLNEYGYNNYNIFMGVAEEIGYEPNGKPTRSGKNDLDKILEEYLIAKSNNFYSTHSFKKISDSCLVTNISNVSNRIDARYYWFMNRLNEMSFDSVELGDYIEIQSNKVSPKESAPDDVFSIVSVTKAYGIILDEGDEKKFEVKGSDIPSAYKVVKTGDIVFNPYRVNVGSIGIVGEEFDNYLTSPAYVVFKTKNGLNPKVLCALFKNNFYNLYIDIIGLGSIRTSLSATKLKKLKIPKEFINGDVSNIMQCYEEIDNLKAQIAKKNNEMQAYISTLIK